MKKLALGFGLFVALFGARARADVPAGYKGTPFHGTATSLPGRVDFENFDEGGQDVAWRVDDHTGNFGVGGCASNNYRNDLPHPQLCLTNQGTEVDTYTMGPMMGQKYPSDAMPQSIYIGYTHAVDWVKLTVNVSKAGKYHLSSVWASEPGGVDAIKFQISFNDVLKADVKLPGTGGYHNWVAAPDFATVDLDAGVQVLQFAAKSMHLNYDYIQFSLELPGGGLDDGSNGTGGSGGGGAGGAAAGGATAGGAGGAAAMTAGTGGATAGGAGMAPIAGTGGAFVGVDPAPTGGSGTGTAGTSAAAGMPGSAGSGTNLGFGSGQSNDSSGCSIALPRSGRASGWLLAALGVAGTWGGRRFRARRRRPSRGAA